MSKNYFFVILPEKTEDPLKYMKDMNKALKDKQLIGTSHFTNNQKHFTFLMSPSQFVKRITIPIKFTHKDSFDQIFAQHVATLAIVSETDEIYSVQEFLTNVLDLSSVVTYSKNSFDIVDDGKEWE